MCRTLFQGGDKHEGEGVVDHKLFQLEFQRYLSNSSGSLDSKGEGDLASLVMSHPNSPFHLIARQIIEYLDAPSIDALKCVSVQWRRFLGDQTKRWKSQDGKLSHGAQNYVDQTEASKFTVGKGKTQSKFNERSKHN